MGHPSPKYSAGFKQQAVRLYELEVALAAGGAAGEPPFAHATLHGGVGAPVPPLRDQPVVDALRGVALLARRAQISLEHGVDPCGVVRRERAARPRLRLRRSGRQVGHVGVFGHGVAAQAQPARDPHPRDPGGIQLAYIIDIVQGHGHLLHPSRAGPAKSPPGTTLRRGLCPWPLEHGPHD